MSEAKNGDNVQVHYTGKLDDGTVFDSSEGRDPLEFQLGAGNVIPGFEAAVVGMQEGETRKTHIAPEDAYGPYRDDMVIVVPRSEFPPDIQPEVGQQLQVHQENDQAFVVQVVEVNDAEVKLDANHPLAGEALNFEINLVKIV